MLVALDLDGGRMHHNRETPIVRSAFGLTPRPMATLEMTSFATGSAVLIDRVGSDHPKSRGQSPRTDGARDVCQLKQAPVFERILTELNNHGIFFTAT
jgi:hypothetical protein